METRPKIKSKIHIFCNTNKTEPIYFKEIKNEYHLHSVEVIKKPQTSPWSLIEMAIQYKNSELYKEDGDIVYCIFDVDQYFKENSKKFLQSIKDAKENEIYLIFSNKCFELWLLLHFQEVFNSMSAKETLSKLKKHIPKYNKGYNVYQEIKNKTNNAIERNKKLFNKEQQSINWQRYLNEIGNPSTNVYQIIEKIQKKQEEN